jgi:hypothetical protein
LSLRDEVEEIQNQLHPPLVLFSFDFEGADRNGWELLQALFAFGAEEGNRNHLDLLLDSFSSVFEVATWIRLELLHV